MILTKQLLLASLNECQVVSGDKKLINTATFTVNSNCTSATGGVVVDRDLKIIWVAFKGSKEFKDFIYDAKFRRQTVRFNSDDCKVRAHSGFWEQMLSIKDGIDDLLKKTMIEHPNYSVAITGHSLGGGIASCYSVASSYVKKDSIMITFGSPAPGNEEFKNFVLYKVGHVFRVFNERDLVPKLLNVFGDKYHHVGYEIELSDKRRGGVAPANIAAGMVNHDTIIDYEMPIQAMAEKLNDEIKAVN